MSDIEQRIAAAKGAIEDRTHGGKPETFRAEVKDIELREEGDKLQFVGHAAVFDRLSEDLGGFRERIQRGAFRKVLDRNPDVRFLINHDGLPLARTTNGTLELREDPKGLRVFAELAPTQAGKDLGILTKRGDVSQMSFAFSLHREQGGQDVWEEDDGELVRTIVSFGDLFDVSAVTYPAYPQTDAKMLREANVEDVTANGRTLNVTISGDASNFNPTDLARSVGWQLYTSGTSTSPEPASERGATAPASEGGPEADAGERQTGTEEPGMSLDAARRRLRVRQRSLAA